MFVVGQIQHAHVFGDFDQRAEVGERLVQRVSLVSVAKLVDVVQTLALFRGRDRGLGDGALRRGDEPNSAVKGSMAWVNVFKSVSIMCFKDVKGSKTSKDQRRQRIKEVKGSKTSKGSYMVAIVEMLIDG